MDGLLGGGNGANVSAGQTEAGGGSAGNNSDPYCGGAGQGGFHPGLADGAGGSGTCCYSISNN